jgi:hypothetical protein
MSATPEQRDNHVNHVFGTRLGPSAVPPAPPRVQLCTTNAKLKEPQQDARRPASVTGGPDASVSGLVHRCTVWRGLGIGAGS